MERVYLICIVVGITIPLVTLFLGSLGDIFEFAFDGVLDVLNASIGFDPCIDFGGIDFCLLPFSIQCLSGGALVFGGVGKIMYNGHNLVATNVVAGILAYIVAMLLQTLIRFLKKVENTTYSKEQLLLFDAKVVNSIITGGFGSISVTTTDGITTVYPAVAEDKTVAIRQDSIVSIVRFDKNIAVVKEKKTDEQEYEKNIKDLR